MPQPLTAGPITGVSTINSRLPSAALPAQLMGGPAAAAYGDDDDEDDDPTAKKPNPSSLFPENKWLEKYPNPIQLLVQVNLGADAAAANVPSAIPLELSVKTKMEDIKQMVVAKISAASVTATSLKFKAQASGFI